MSRALGICEIRDDHPSKWQKVVSLKPAIDAACEDFSRPIVVDDIVAMQPSRPNATIRGPLKTQNNFPG